MDLNGKNVIVTGSSRGIGKAIAIELARRGMNVVINHVQESTSKKASEVKKIIEKMGQKAIIIRADISNPIQVKKLFSNAVRKFKIIHVLVNNAGIFPFNPSAGLFELTENDYQRVFDVNTKGTFLCSREAARHMIKNNVVGRIINISSDVALDVSSSGSHYGASKAAVLSFTKSWSVELAPYNIIVNSVAPGPTDTDLLRSLPKKKIESYVQGTPLKRIAKPIEVALAVSFLIETDFVSGQTLLVNGARIRH